MSWSQLPGSGGGWRWQDTARNIAVDLGTDWLRDNLGLQPNQRPGSDVDPSQWLPGGTPGLQQNPGGFDFGGFNLPINIHNNMPEQQQQPDQSWWQRLLDRVLDGIGSGVEQSVGTATNRVTDGFLGNPSPGQLFNDYANEAFPGTNPWERLGSQAAQAGMQQKMKQQELQTRIQIAKIGAQGQVQAAKEAARPAMSKVENENLKLDAERKQILETLRPMVNKMDSESKLNMQKGWEVIQRIRLMAEQTQLTGAQKDLANAQTGLTQGRSDEQQARLKEIDNIVRAALTESEYGSWKKWINGFDNWGEDFSETLTTVGSMLVGSVGIGTGIYAVVKGLRAIGRVGGYQKKTKSRTYKGRVGETRETDIIETGTHPAQVHIPGVPRK